MRSLAVGLFLIFLLGLGVEATRCEPPTVPVTFTYVPLPGEAITSVSLRGTFNDWGEWPLELQADGTWTITVCLAPGIYEYKFFINGQWPKDMSTARGGGPVDFDADGYVDDGFGGKNAVRKVGTFISGKWEFKMKLVPSAELTYNNLELTYSVAGFEITSLAKFETGGSFDELGFTLSGLVAGLVDFKGGMYFDPRAVAYKHTFVEGKASLIGASLTAKVEHWSEPYLPSGRCVQRVVFTYKPRDWQTEVYGVTVPGSWNGWNTTADSMTYDPSTGTWSVTVYLTPGEHTYKYFIKDNTNPSGYWVTDMSDFGGAGPASPEADGYADDGFGGQNAIHIVRSPCEEDLVAVTFTYKPRAWQAQVYAVTVPGSWNGWDPTAHPMTEQSDGTWAVTIYLSPGVYEFKYYIEDDTNPSGYWVSNMADFGGEGPASPEANGYRYGNAVIAVGDPMPNYMRYTLTAEWGNFKGILRFEDCCCGNMFKDVTLTLSDLSLCCGITYDAELYFTKHGFQFLKFSADDLFSLCCDISLGIEVEFGVDYKRVTPKFTWAGITGCVNVYGDLQLGGANVGGLEIYGLKLRCDIGDCSWLEVLTAFDVAKIEEIFGADIFFDQEFQYVKLGTCGLACCGENYNLTVTAFFGGGGLFDITRIWLDVEVPLTDDLRFIVNFSPTIPELYLGWTWKF
jgi:hypothetical protein